MLLLLTKLVRKAGEEQSNLHGLHTMHNAMHDRAKDAPIGRREKDHLHA